MHVESGQEMHMPACKKMIAFAAAAACFAAVAQTTPRADASTSAQARYQQERAACLSGRSHQDRTTCLQEAGAALQEARRGGLTTGAQLEANAIARCNALPEGDRADCHSRVKNQANTTVSGSVEGGGILKETRTRYVQTPEGEKPIQ
jgi:hypothetical protein